MMGLTKEFVLTVILEALDLQDDEKPEREELAHA
jgi:hypothetical protein